MPRNEKSDILSETTYVGEMLDQEGFTSFISSASSGGMGWMPRTLRETTAEVKSRLSENRYLDASLKSDLGAGRLHCKICLTSPDQGKGSLGSAGGAVGKYMPMSYLGVWSNTQRENPNAFKHQETWVSKLKKNF